MHDLDDMDELYQQLILDHNARPHNFGAMPEATHQARGYNPLCGDEVTIYVQLQGDTLAALQFFGQGCAISKASASLMTDALLGKRREEAERLFAAFHALLTGQNDATGHSGPSDMAAAASEPAAPDLGKLQALGGVRAFPMRVKCATLAWHTLRAALDSVPAPVCTET